MQRGRGSVLGEGAASIESSRDYLGTQTHLLSHYQSWEKSSAPSAVKPASVAIEGFQM